MNDYKEREEMAIYLRFNIDTETTKYEKNKSVY
jgi:hypothetical protein